MSLLRHLLLTCSLYAFHVHMPAECLHLTRCNNANYVEIVENQQPSLECTGLSSNVNVSWFIRGTKVGECGHCQSTCNTCSSTNSTTYKFSRTENQSTVQFLDPVAVRGRPRINCQDSSNNKSNPCTLVVIPAYRLPECKDGVVEVGESRETAVNCRGLLGFQKMYWTMKYPDGGESLIADCARCTIQQPCPRYCDVQDTDFNVTRQNSVSTLVIQNNVQQKDGATLKCSRRDNVTSAECKIRVSSYRIRDCKENVLDIAENKSNPVECMGLSWYQNMHWTITYPNGTESRIADCARCTNEQPCPRDCEVQDSDYIVTIHRQRSFLVIENNKVEKDGATLKCSQGDNLKSAECKISIRYADTVTDTPQSSDLTTIIATVAGVVAGCVVVVVVVVVICCVFFRRRDMGENDATDGGRFVASDSGPAEGGPTYDSLQMLDVGQPSVYSQVTPPAVNNTDDNEYLNPYNRLDQAQVGLPSEYSQLGHQSSDSPTRKDGVNTKPDH